MCLLQMAARFIGLCQKAMSLALIILVEMIIIQCVMTLQIGPNGKPFGP